MKFKLVHMRPHVWFFKQQKETIAKPGSNDDTSSSDDTGTYVYKRSTSLRLVKSERVPERTCKPLHASKSSSAIGNTELRTHPQGKDVKVCTVVDAGCTCRATLTSQHKAQKKGLGVFVPNAANGGLGSLHDVCKPRWAPLVFEAKGEDAADVGSRHDVCRPRRRARQVNSKHAASASNMSALTTPLGTASNSVVSRLVCKSTQDVVKTRVQSFRVERCDAVNKLANSLDSEYGHASYVGEDNAGAAPGLDVHQLECRLRNAGLAERRRSSKKANKYYEEGISSGVSSTNSTNYSNTDSLITCSTTEMQDMLLNANPAFDTDAPSTGDSMLSLKDIRASIEQRKLTTYHTSAQASVCGKGDGVHGNAAASMCSPSSLSSGNTPACVQNLVCRACEEDSSAKHSNLGVSKRLHFSECNVVSKQEVLSSKQSPRKVSTDMSSARKEEEHSRLPRKTSRRIDLSAQKGSDVQQELKKSSANRIKGEIHEASKHSREVDDMSERRSFAQPDSSHICAGAAHEEIGQQQAKKQAASNSSSCEIQVLSDYNFDHSSDGKHAYPMIRMHVDGALSSGAVLHAQGAACSVQAKFGTASSTTPRVPTTAASDVSKPNSLEHELMRNETAVAMVKSSYDPKLDFKESMLEMVVAKRLRAPRQLQQLLQCYLSLNPSHYHPTIIKVFHELCSELFN